MGLHAEGRGKRLITPMPSDKERLDWVIANQAMWAMPSRFGAAIAYQGRWIERDGYGCEDDLSPRNDDPRIAIDLAIEADKAKSFVETTLTPIQIL